MLGVGVDVGRGVLPREGKLVHSTPDWRKTCCRVSSLERRPPSSRKSKFTSADSSTR